MLKKINRESWMPASIVMAGLMISAGVFFGIVSEKQCPECTSNGDGGTVQKWTEVGTEALKQYASILELDTDTFNSCLDSGTHTQEVQNDLADGQSFGISGTPSFLIISDSGNINNNGRVILEQLNDSLGEYMDISEMNGLTVVKLRGAHQYAVFKNILDSLISGATTRSNTSEYIDDNEILGRTDAPITIVEFSDFQCAFCKRFTTQTLPQIQTNYIDTGAAKLVFRDFPLGFHQFAQAASEATECAGDQGKFWEYHDILFQYQ